MTAVSVVCAYVYVLVVELAPVPQILKLRSIKESDQVSLLFTASLAVGRLMALPYVFHKQALIMGWGLLAGALLRFVLLGQSVYYQRRTLLHKRMREEDVII